MQRIIVFSIPLIALPLVSACDSEDIVRVPSEYICEQAENRYIDGETGTRPVRLYEGFGRYDIGYSHQGSLINHSECAPAAIVLDGQSTSFTYYEYGTVIEVDGVTQLTFTPKNNLLNIEAQRIGRVGVADLEFSERGLEYDSSAIMTKRVWSNETPSMVVTAVRNFDAVILSEVKAELPNASKTRTFNANTQQWDCAYLSSVNGNAVDPGCVNEGANDLTYIGFSIDLEPYFSSLDERIPYETEPERLWDEVDIYR